MKTDSGLTLTDWLGIAGFFLAVIGLLWQAGTWFLQYRIRLKMAMFIKSSVIVVEAVNLSRAHSVQIRDVRIKWPGAEFVLPEDTTWTQSARVEPLGIFQAVVPLESLKSQVNPFPSEAYGWVKTASGKEFRSESVRLP